MENYVSFASYVLKNFNNKSLRNIAKNSYNISVSKSEINDDFTRLFDKFPEDAWDFLYFGSKKHQLPIVDYIRHISAGEHEIETIQGFKNLIAKHAIMRIARIKAALQTKEAK